MNFNMLFGFGGIESTIIFFTIIVAIHMDGVLHFVNHIQKEKHFTFSLTATKMQSTIDVIGLHFSYTMIELNIKKHNSYAI